MATISKELEAIVVGNVSWLQQQPIHVAPVQPDVLLLKKLIWELPLQVIPGTSDQVCILHAKPGTALQFLHMFECPASRTQVALTQEGLNTVAKIREHRRPFFVLPADCNVHDDKLMRYQTITIKAADYAHCGTQGRLCHP